MVRLRVRIRVRDRVMVMVIVTRGIPCVAHAEGTHAVSTVFHKHLMTIRISQRYRRTANLWVVRA